MNPIIKEEKDGRLVILQRGSGYKFEKLGFDALQEAWDAGYRFPEGDPELMADYSMRNYQGMITGKYVLFAEGCDPTKKKETKAEPIPEPIVEPVVVAKVEVKAEKKVTPKKKAGSSNKNK